MRHLQAIAQRLNTAGLAQLGRDLFLFTIPTDVQNGTMLRGPLSGDPIDHGQGGFSDTEFLLIVRDSDAERAYQRCLAMSQCLTVYDEELAPGIWVVRMVPMVKPTPYPRNNAGVIEWSVRFVIAFGEYPPA